jgi:hypothetical protein
MIVQKHKGGEFYAQGICEYCAMHAQWQNSSIEQLQSIVAYIPVLIGVAARGMLRPSIFFASKLPRVALDSSLIKTLKLQ